MDIGMMIGGVPLSVYVTGFAIGIMIYVLYEYGFDFLERMVNRLFPSIEDEEEKETEVKR